jgi:hypothetical protein
MNKTPHYSGVFKIKTLIKEKEDFNYDYSNFFKKA